MQAGAERRDGPGGGEMIAIRRGQQAAQHGNTQRAAELTSQVVDGRADVLQTRGQRAGDRGRGRRHRQPQPGPQRDQSAGDVPVGVGAVQVRQHHQPLRHNEQAGDPGKPDAESFRQVRAEPGTGNHPDRHGQQAQCGGQRAVVTNRLQVLHDHEQKAEQREELQGDRERAGRKASVGEQPRVEQRVAAPHLDDDETGQDEQAQRDTADRDRIGPAVRRSLDHRVDQHRDARGRQHRANHVKRERIALGRLRHKEQRAGQRHRGQHHVQPKNRLPGPPLQQQPRGEQAHHPAGTGDGGPDADRSGASLRRKAAGDGRQRGGHDQRGADSQQGTQPGQRGGVGGQGGHPGSGAEHNQADQQRQPSAVAVPHRAGGQQQGCEHQAVGVHNPSLLGLVGMGLPGDIGQRHIQRGHRRDHRSQGQAGDGQDQTLMPGPANQRGLRRGWQRGEHPPTVTRAPVIFQR
ncbi:ligA protein [Mycobacterium pseudoshottsii JCM 15466]|nr:ligA protein [Mycobacterium pseudoshottsii JCM 15466]